MRTRSLLPYQLRVLGFDPENDCQMREDHPDGTGGNVYISEWKSLRPQPTKEELNSVIAEAEALEMADIEAAKNYIDPLLSRNPNDPLP